MGLGDLWDVVEDVGGAVASGAGAVGNFIEGLFDAAAGAAGGVVDWFCDGLEGFIDDFVTWVYEHGGSILGAIAAVLGGILNGALEGFSDIFHDFLNILRDFGSMIGSILRLDFAGFIQAIGNLLLDAFRLSLDDLRLLLGGYFVGGIVEQFEREALRSFVKTLLQERFGHDSALLERINNKLAIHGADWGLPMSGRHYVFMLDSLNTPLWQWHQDGTLDLYALAGFLSFDSFQVQRPRTWVREVRADEAGIFPVTRSVIKEYLESQGESRRLRVYAMTPEAANERLEVAIDKCQKIGIKISWDESATYGYEIKSKEVYQFHINTQVPFVRDHGLRTGNISEECVLLGLGAFHVLGSSKEYKGYTAGRDIYDGADKPQVAACPTPGRDDSCCVTVYPVGSSVIHRDVWPPFFFRYVLAHELGHYLGLCHYGHDGLQNIMYTAEPEANLDCMKDLGMFRYYYRSEPEFSLSDGKNVWRFIVENLQCCLDKTLTCQSINQSDR